MRRHYIISLLTAVALIIAMSGFAYGIQFPTQEGSCEYDGTEITSDFDASGPDASQSGLEPGDEVDYVVTYTNNSDETTEWYMINTVLETLEKNGNQAENGGYTYLLKNVGPDGTETVLFDNSKTVGGKNSNKEKGYNIPEGLKEATNATGEYFFIQELKPYQSGKTILHVSFEGESEVNDYMDTEGALMVKYAVEKKAKGEKKTIYSHTKTGDNMDLLKFLALMSAAVLVAILAILSWRRDRREDGDEA